MMGQIQPYKIIWWTITSALALLLLGFKTTFHLQAHDTYFVIATFHVAMGFSLLLGIIGATYWLLRNYKLIRSLSLIHSVISAFAINGIILGVASSIIFEFKEIELFQSVNSLLFVLIAVLILIQVLFIINIIIGLLRGVK